MHVFSTFNATQNANEFTSNSQILRELINLLVKLWDLCIVLLIIFSQLKRTYIRIWNDLAKNKFKGLSQLQANLRFSLDVYLNLIQLLHLGMGKSAKFRILEFVVSVLAKAGVLIEEV